jgi:hypothetical protein
LCGVKLEVRCSAPAIMNTHSERNQFVSIVSYTVSYINLLISLQLPHPASVAVYDRTVSA